MLALTRLDPPDHSRHEQVVSVSDAATGLQAYIAIHSTARGPAFGGCRMMPYPSRRAALRDALRLSETMSKQAALAGMPFGGGMCVVLADPGTWKTDALFQALGRAIAALDGRFIASADMGISAPDLQVIRSVTPHVRGLQRPKDEPGPAAAYGTFLAIQAAVSHSLGKPGLSGCRVAVQGLGDLGMQLGAYLAEAGARLLVADRRPERVIEAVQRFGATAVPADQILSTGADVLSPNACGEVINDSTVPLIRAGIIVGGAMNQLRAARHGIALHRRGILYVPDCVTTAGGLIDAAMEGPGYQPLVVRRACESIRHTTTRLLREAHLLGLAPSELADRTAAEQMQPPHSGTFRILSLAQLTA
jgi:leucine dehydrogenase